jgi:hypothetical protein
MKSFMYSRKHGSAKLSLLWELALEVILKLVRGGDLGENLIMGGIICAEWNGRRAMVMDHINPLMLECGSDTFVIRKSTIL